MIEIRFSSFQTTGMREFIRREAIKNENLHNFVFERVAINFNKISNTQLS